MRKGFLCGVYLLVVLIAFSPFGCGNGETIKIGTIKIGINAPLTGDIPKVGEGTKFAAQMWLEDIQAAGGLEVGGKKYPVELVIKIGDGKAKGPGDMASDVNRFLSHIHRDQ